MIRRRLLPLAALALASLGPASPLLAQKAVIESAEQLPRHSYALSGTATQTLEDSAKFEALATALERDILSDLSTYEIRDRSTLKEYYGTLGAMALTRGHWDAAVAWSDSVKAVEDKPAPKAMEGMTVRALAAAAKVPKSQRAAAFRAAYTKEVAALPYEKVQAELKAAKGRAQILSKGLLLGAVQSTIEPAARSGSLSLQFAESLVGVRAALDEVLPVRDQMVAVLSDAIKAHSTEKPDIWGARDVSLEGRKGLTPVVLGIWDSGVDVSLYRGQLFTNSGEVPGNGVDDDRDGFVDDVHGIAWTLHSDPTTSLLFPLTYGKDKEAKFRSYLKGFTDLQAGLDSRAADSLKSNLSSLSPQEFKPLIEGLNEYSNYAHGTHVAGIAARGNPAARIAVARLTYDYHTVPEKPTVAQAEKDAKAARETVDWFRAHGVRVVNMSWGGTPRDVEHALELNNAGGTPAERKALARKIFDIFAHGLEQAIKSAPDILFVPAAGNADADNRFSDFMPASIDLPNVVTAAAVDRAGDEAAFTSYGKADVYADGYEVESRLPGGQEMRLSGTSMAAPQVVNLAGKLLAVKPDLSVSELRHLIVDGADEKVIGGTHKIRLLNPKGSMEMLSGMR